MLRRRKNRADAPAPGPASAGEASAVPILAVDVDGVISLFGFDGNEVTGPGVMGTIANAPGEYHLIDGTLHCISRGAAERLRRLGSVYQLVWATGWEERANESLCPILGLPELDCLSFGGDARFGTAHWKLGPIESYAAGRPLAWIDDSHDKSCFEWAESRPEPTLLVPADPARGIEDAHVETMLAWARDGFSPR